jgi:hypothetical protein
MRRQKRGIKWKVVDRETGMVEDVNMGEGASCYTLLFQSPGTTLLDRDKIYAVQCLFSYTFFSYLPFLGLSLLLARSSNYFSLSLYYYLLNPFLLASFFSILFPGLYISLSTCF